MIGSQKLRFFVLVLLVILVCTASALIIYWQRIYNYEIPDPEIPLPPSSTPMGLYPTAGVVSNGGPCAQIGVDVLLKGGNAVDAAIATLLCDGVYCPEFMGIGGGFLMSIYNATTKKVMTINARETAPAAATVDMFKTDPKKSLSGGLAIGVPGELKGYSTIYNLYGGRVSWESLFEPTIQSCKEGIEINKRLERNLKSVEKMIQNNAVLRETFINKETGLLKKAGERYKFSKLAGTMEIIAKEGVDAIYKGSLTQQLLDDLKKVNSIITEEDLANYKVEIKESFPVNLKNGYKIHVAPPPSSSIILAYILRVLDGMLPAPNAGLDAHRLVEAFKFGYGERTHLGDHNFVNVSSLYDNVKSDCYIQSIRRKISDSCTSLDPKYYGADFDMPENHGTANMAVIDSAGNVVVCTSTVNTHFGSGFVSPSTGIILNNEMNDFSIPDATNVYGFPSSPANYINPGKRPMSSMCPTIITNNNDDFVLGVGAAGGSKITTSSAYISALKLWYNKTMKEAIDKPRVYHQLVPMEIQYDYGTTKDVVQKLKDIGHPMVRLKNIAVAAATGIAISSSGIEAMSDFRRLGNTSGY